MTTSRQLVKNAIEGKGIDRIPICISFTPDESNGRIVKEIENDFESDILVVIQEDPEFVPIEEGYSQLGYKSETLGETMGEVTNPPLSDWGNFGSWKASLPNFSKECRYENAKRLRTAHPDKFLVGGINQMMEEIINLRGYEDYMVDFYEEEENLKALIDTLYAIGKQIVDGYAKAGMDAVLAWEDWGLQHAPMISHALWKKFFYAKMKDFVDYIHAKGMKYILHSCGHILYLMDDFVDMGIDVLQLDQQNNMGLDKLNQWSKKICFWAPVDIQLSVNMTRDEMKAYITELVQKLGHEKGGFMYKPYCTPAAIHMSTAQLRQEMEFMQEAWQIRSVSK